MKPLRVVSFSDGRPGHEKQTRGVLTALARLTPLEISTLTVDRSSLTASVKSWLSYFVASVRQGGSGKRQHRVDLIIGTGSSTHLPMLRYNNECIEAKVVTCMTPDFPLKRKMDLCFVPWHDRQNPCKNVFITLGPPNNLAYADNHDERKGLILVGGIDPKSHQWSSDMIEEQIKTVVQKETDLRWTISSSPRTPVETISKIIKLVSQVPGIEFFSSDQTPSGWIERQYLQNFTVWVTADSISMVYEALTAGCRVGILPVKWKRDRNKFQKSWDYLATKKYITTYEKWLSEGYLSTRGVRFDEASRCAKELLRRWWPDRLP